MTNLNEISFVYLKTAPVKPDNKRKFRSFNMGFGHP